MQAQSKDSQWLKTWTSMDNIMSCVWVACSVLRSPTTQKERPWLIHVYELQFWWPAVHSSAVHFIHLFQEKGRLRLLLKQLLSARFCPLLLLKEHCQADHALRACRSHVSPLPLECSNGSQFLRTSHSPTQLAVRDLNYWQAQMETASHGEVVYVPACVLLSSFCQEALV